MIVKYAILTEMKDLVNTDEKITEKSENKWPSVYSFSHNQTAQATPIQHNLNMSGGTNTQKKLINSKEVNNQPTDDTKSLGATNSHNLSRKTRAEDQTSPHKISAFDHIDIPHENSIYNQQVLDCKNEHHPFVILKEDEIGLYYDLVDKQNIENVFDKNVPFLTNRTIDFNLDCNKNKNQDQSGYE